MMNAAALALTIMLAAVASARGEAFNDEDLQRVVPTASADDYFLEGRRYLIVDVDIPSASIDEAIRDATIAFRWLDAYKSTFGAASDPDNQHLDPSFDQILLNLDFRGEATSGFQIIYRAMPWSDGGGPVQPYDLLSQGQFNGASDRGIGLLHGWCGLGAAEIVENFCASTRPRFCRSTFRDRDHCPLWPD